MLLKCFVFSKLQRNLEIYNVYMYNEMPWDILKNPPIISGSEERAWWEWGTDDA